jgi:putative colanic acid biosynthesis UDP-glucose lipid carrier transferase
MIFRRGIVKAHSSQVLFLFRLSDAAAILVAGLVSYYSVAGSLLPDANERLYLMVIAVFGFALLAEWVGLYVSQRGKRFYKEAARIVFVGAAVFTILLVLNYVAPWSDQDAGSGVPTWLGYWFPSVVIVMIASRLGLRTFLQWIRSRGWNLRHVVIVGANGNIAHVSSAVARHPEFGIRIDGYFDDRAVHRGESVSGYRRLGTVQELSAYAEHHDIDQVWIDYPIVAQGRCKEVLNLLRDSTVDIRFLMHTTDFSDGATQFTDFAGLPLLEVAVTPLEGLGYFYKLIEDKLVAALVLALLSPLFVALAVGVKLSSPGPVFYRQERISWNNRPFMMLKFRSMPVDVESESGPKWASQGENRATRFGAFLRRTSLDELPQFINVLKGDMSVVGPRPERPVFVEQFKDEIPAYMKKHMVKAGITGWAQVNGLRGDTDLHKRIEYDLFYIRNWSLMFDFSIAMKTFVSGFINKNAY